MMLHVCIKTETGCILENCLKNSFENYLQNAYSNTFLHTKNNFQETISFYES